ncbi:MAG: BadF/BadG/BcrA/BcrD ATPase family protein [bacterium]
MRRAPTCKPDVDEALLAVDGGGSKARAVLEFQGRLAARALCRGINPRDIVPLEFERRLRSLLGPLFAWLEASSPGRPVEVSACVALAGVGMPSARHRCETAARRTIERHGICRRLVLLTDAGALVEARLSQRDGVVLIAGTGSIALAVKHRRGRSGGVGSGRTQVARAGGRGGFADRGSGVAIGMGLVESAVGVRSETVPEGLLLRGLYARRGHSLESVARAFLRQARPWERARISAVAPILIEACFKKDPAAMAIVERAAADLAKLAAAAAERAGLRGRFEVHLSGGLFASRPFSRLVASSLRRALPGARVRMVREPVLEVLGLARRWQTRRQVARRPPAR